MASNIQNSNDYYIPDIEDIRVGYEFELINYASNNYNEDKSTCTWTKHTLKKDNIFSKYKEDSFLETCISYLNTVHLRVPYLTKEQIENEGWIITFYKDSEKPHFIKKDFECFIYKNNLITIVTTGYDFLYKGECKSINEFRTICKLLKI